jgi:malonyl-CoA/methylmalonyl-CoA synthetase
MIKLIDRIRQFKDRIAIVDVSGKYSYVDLILSSEKVASKLLSARASLNEARVSFLIPSSFEYAAVILGIWQAGGIAVPMCVHHPDPELEYVLQDSGAEIVIAHPDFEDRLMNLASSNGAQFFSLKQFLNSKRFDLPDIDVRSRAMIVYTSGSTGKPKGVVTTHKNIESQISTLVQAWGWTKNDSTLNVLPLHHVHGIVNVLLCALWSGAGCEMMPRFDADLVWEKFLQNEYSLFMAVPTIYSRLIRVWDEASPETKKEMSEACKKMRLMVSGSAALPVSTLEKWKDISGHVLLERYGMTEIGMALSNPLNGERVAGHVGKPLPNVEIKLDRTDEITKEEAGEILIKGPNVFLEYWNKPEATGEAFTEDGWFKTGDIASVNKDGVYRILGRHSVDIIKSGGYKISALEIEEVLRQHPDIAECSVVGVEDMEWGERVGAAIVTIGKSDLSPDVLRSWCKKRLATYKIPAMIELVSDLPRNVMGKVVKPEVRKLFLDNV